MKKIKRSYHFLIGKKRDNRKVILTSAHIAVVFSQNHIVYEMDNEYDQEIIFFTLFFVNDVFFDL